MDYARGAFAAPQGYQLILRQRHCTTDGTMENLVAPLKGYLRLMERLAKPLRLWVAF